MTQITISLNKILASEPCKGGWESILKGRGKAAPDDEEFPLSEAFESNSVQDVIWAFRCLPEHDRLWRKFSVWCARQVQHLMTDSRSVAALDVAWRHSEGQATDEELADASDAAWTAMAAAWAASDAASTASTASTARAAARSARSAARDAASDAASDAAAWASSDAAQKAKLIQILDAGEWVE